MRSGSTVSNVVFATSGCSSPSMITTSLSGSSHCLATLAEEPLLLRSASRTWSATSSAERWMAEPSTPPLRFEVAVGCCGWSKSGLMSGGDEERESAGGNSSPSNGTFLDAPELSASMMVDNSAERSGPGEGVRKVKACSVA
jgi:hypothetical protein